MSQGSDDHGLGRHDSASDATEMDDRDQTAEDRDRAAEEHDESAASRDSRSEERDSRAEARDAQFGKIDVQAASDRAGARRDRQAAASDRQQAEDDRVAALDDRQISAVQRSEFLYDALTQVFARDAGLLELEREVVSAQRTGEPFVLAFIDVDGLKGVNDSRGHDAGDDVLSAVAAAIRAAVRKDDVVVRYGGDEFLCGLAGITLAEAEPRFARMNQELKDSANTTSVGLAELEPAEDLTALIQRADQLMYRLKPRSADVPSQQPSDGAS